MASSRVSLERQRLSRLVGKTKALEMILTGAAVSAQEALAMGLVNRVVPAADLMREARALAAELASKPAIALRYALEAVNRAWRCHLPMDAGSKQRCLAW